ncbi:hypothetical protein Mgra_00001710 [Meloidogyne graminicola]|uniref:Uncharacterized protein n=1 Tax=Meloidogyne graminicola TaxID=189291 RepID=A0A8S9ZYY4_9BILA|nr:hypothetical protein Mgra_00001710 [Meloidogyne graminicola]
MVEQGVYPEYIFKRSIIDPVEVNILRWQNPTIKNKRSNQPSKRLFLARIGKRGMMPIYRARVG